MQFSNSQRSIGLLAAFLMLAAVFSVSVVQPAQSQSDEMEDKIPGKITGNIGIVSKYVFRGFVESDRPAVQGGIDYTHPSGFYAGYWGSTLGSLSYGGSSQGGANNGGDATSTENDYYVGFSSSAGALSYGFDVTQFTYLNNTGQPDLTEAGLSLGYGPVSFTSDYALNDGFQAEGDIYSTVSVSKTLINDLSGSAKIGYELADPSGVEDGIEDVVIGISNPIGDSGASFSLQYIFQPGDPVDGNTNFDNQVVMGLSYGFGIAK